jgi:chromosome segregation ATPase
MDLFEKITSRRRDRELSAQEQLAAAAKRHVRGENVDVGSIEEALFTTDQTVEDFRKLCDAEAKRKDCFTKLELGSSMKTKLEKIDAQAVAETTKFQEIESGFNARLAKLDQERREVAPVVEAAAAAKEWLLNPKNVVGALGEHYRELLSNEEQAKTSVEQLQRVTKELSQELKSADSDIERLRAQYDKTIEGTWRPREARQPGHAHVRPLPDRVQAEIDEIEVQKTRLSRKLSEAQTQLDAASALVPAAKAAVVAIQKKLLQP